jgi:integrase
MMMVLITTNGDSENQRYSIRYYAGIDTETGKRNYRQEVFRTLEEAEEFKKLVERELNEVVSGQNGNETNLSFREFVECWFYGTFQLVASPTVYKTYRSTLENQIVPFFGDKSISELTINDMEAYKDHLDKKEYSKGTIKRISKVLSRVLDMAYLKGMVKENLMANIQLLQKSKNREPLIWNTQEVACFIQTAEKDEDGLMHHLALLTGTRLDELLSLTWADIDFEVKTVTISKQFPTGKDEEDQVTSLKSGSHTLPLSSPILTKLTLHKELQETHKKEMGDSYPNGLNLVFPNRNGGFQNPKMVLIKLDRLIKEAGVPKIRFADFRRTYANLLIQSGMNLLSIQQLLRYHSLDSTFRMLAPFLHQEEKEPLERQ